MFKDSAIIEIEDIPLCTTHAKDYIDSNWFIFKELECTPDNQEKSVSLYEQKLLDYKNGELGFIKSSYIERDNQIVTVMKYYKKRED